MSSGSQTPPALPDRSCPSLILTQPTDAERRKTWSLTHPLWGPALRHEDYVNREAYLTTVPLAKDGGLSQWILTDPSLPPNERPILSACETLRKRAIRARPDGSVDDGIAHGIGAVFTDPQYRGRGYANRMMRDLGPRLRSWQGESKRRNSNPDEVFFSVLYSDIGKSFYAKTGWAPFESTHFSFDPVPGAASGISPHDGYAASKARPIGYHEMAELCSVDERLLRERIARRAKEEGRTAVALLPDLDQLLWHLMREDYMTKHIFGRTPTVRGAVYGEKGGRVWAVWTRAYYGGLEKPEGNTLHLLRVVVEDEEGMDEERVREGFREVLRIAQSEAEEWRLQEVQMWNPTGLLRRAVEGCGVEARFVERERESIASLMWYGNGEKGVEWFANEKFGWC
ncbi:lysine acetyltransferase [Podospora aff. communis PSN243]|uniref:Lysine acetyltransferase n=1 Tax=Podospora aff. communis PSN243 TaxID=3040156 RepID=A0AAV9G0S5_9PEZI|nr:lysine acetyltransferase [Podospora aff. communis PSN243]